MADSLSERLQPALLDRLTDREPDAREESRNRRIVSLKRLRESVMRDLGWLFNTAAMSVTEDLSAFPEVERSVLNYGIPDLSGRISSSIDIRELERAVKQAIWDFEPRILRNTLRVRVELEQDEMNRNCLVFEIDGELWAQPTPTRLFLKTEVDLENGSVTIADQAAPSVSR